MTNQIKLQYIHKISELMKLDLTIYEIVIRYKYPKQHLNECSLSKIEILYDMIIYLNETLNLGLDTTIDLSEQKRILYITIFS